MDVPEFPESLFTGFINQMTKFVNSIRLGVMVFNTTFNYISVISWQVTDKLYHIMLY